MSQLSICIASTDLDFNVSSNVNVALKFVEPLLERGFDFCSFDFAGSGNSSGDYVSLGHNEKHDIMRLLMHIRDVFGVSKFCLWGRSMGAVSAIKFKDLLVK